MTRPTPAAASAKAVASLSRSDPPGRAKNQRRQVATAKAGTLTEVNCSTTSWAGSSPRSNPFRKRIRSSCSGGASRSACCRRRAERRHRCVFVADATDSVLTDNAAVRLIHRERPREAPLEEGECYDHSYGERVSDHVEVVPLEPAGIRVVEIPVEGKTEHHVTTERLKGQFEERLAARTRRSRRAHP